MKINYLRIGQVIAFVAMLGNLFIWHNSIINSLIFIIYFSLAIVTLGNFLKQKYQLENQCWLAALVSLSFFITIGAIIYYFYQLNNFVLMALLAAYSTIIFILTYKIRLKVNWPKIPKLDIIDLFITVGYLFNAGLIIWQLFKYRTDALIKTPWQVLSSDFFVFYIVATFILILAVIYIKNKKIVQAFTVLHFVLSFSVAIIIYKLGYGFDPFIHQATERVINDSGYILPKKLFYLGQYSLVIFLKKYTAINLVIIDKFLVCLMAVLFIPTSLKIGLKSLAGKLSTSLNINKLTRLGPVLFLLIPFSPFIFSTPQSLAYVFLISTIFLSLAALRSEIPVWIVYCLSLTTAAIHPLAGLLSLGWTVFLHLWLKRWYILALITGLISAVIIPLSFWLNAKISGQSLNFAYQSVRLLDYFKAKYLDYSIRDFIYFFDNYYEVFFLAIALLAATWFIRKKQSSILLLTVFYLVTIINYVVVKKLIGFSELIDYEQADYANRLLEMSLFFLLPIIIFIIAKFFTEVFQKNNWLVKFFFIIILSIIIGASFYLSYPRFDQYAANSGYNVSSEDFQAVDFIEKQASNSPYVVLAPQNTSLAALTNFGFEREYNGLFFYPIPTGGQLYQYYRQIIEQEDFKPAIIQSVIDLTGVSKVYVVINKSWKSSDICIAQLKKDAKNEYFLNNDQTVIFEF